ncbi:DUF1433 domain-containing protein [Bacillus thuringiensis]|uniref:DUF1433 domain-containing protein n=3 Tax=Bacillus thuringiensis TaxID=1428 RepID=A0AB35PP27_BACTU|nr:MULTISPECIES: DUF1433 domain-containing protein [Bacillus]EAO55789.1 hypothetical protein RBTH_06426 [Bacillus thuringiensis serovar israelensis ATCC 35646]MED1157423.1 DUF1433 domain-containing protein [Bacillus paranthracis]AJH08544.1 hypothetical protein AS86_2971 [Bacillus thuringiensis HD1002]AND22950.1 hypothetical protein ATN07_05070 [Bacillus thuringiensis serovar israelensis]EEN04464.1 hypothetical protein bthur0014_8500 [Bacillus thuringiensis IBL 4222]
MKKAMILVISAVILIAGGYFTMEYLNKKEQEEKFWKIQESRIEKYIHYNIENVESITLSDHSVSPMGVPSVEGYINNDKELWFDASISTTDKFEDKFGCSGELDKMIKKPAKSVSEIEKEEKEKKQE